jgi:hydrogenase maturation protease
VNADGVLVVGFGNNLRGDDGVGPRVAELLASEDALPGATIVTRRQVAPELAADMAAARLVVLIDARQDGGTPGDVRVERVVGSGGPIGSHAVDVRAVVDLAERVYGNAPPVVVVSVSAAQFDLGSGLSDAVASSLPRVVDAVIAVVETNRGSASGYQSLRLP